MVTWDNFKAITRAVIRVSSWDTNMLAGLGLIGFRIRTERGLNGHWLWASLG